AAHSAEFDAAYTNPALLSRMREKKITVGWQGATFNLHAEGEGLPGRVSYPPSKGAIIGVGIPIPFGGILKDRIGAAFAFYTPTDILVRGRILYPEKPQFPLLPDRSQSLAARFGLGIDVGYGFRVGAGFAALAQIAGDVVVATDATGRVGSRVEDQLVATYAPIIGISYERKLRHDGVFRGALVYRGTLDARFAVKIDGTKLSSLNIPIFNIAGIAQYDPAQITAEGAYESKEWTLAVGLTLKRWSKYPGLAEPTILCPDDNPDCGALQPTKLALTDTLVPRVGVERALVASKGMTVHLRGGYALESSPTPTDLPPSQAWDPAGKQTTNVPTRFFDASRHIFTVGGGIALHDPLPALTLDVYAQEHILPTRTVNVQPGADSNTGAFGPAKLSGSVMVAGMLLGVPF
ncbi:MAG: hypothetical protein ABIP39_10750, partial [Polyangiaceae bacterium]